MARLKITLYVNTVSPFAYKAYYILRTNRSDKMFKSVDVTYMPVFLSGLMKKVSPLIPNIARIELTMYIVPLCLQMPPNFPPLTLYIIRTLCALKHSDPRFSTLKQEKLVRALNHLFTRY
ncbi:hypothetical protein QBC46DRAFT_267312 [Diplogelasinospora grovesii]|uniref:Uncharacterized protein n=1 Tax=Diplogelasinospora grovesii TaxID=303347 RepID=A0AAN6S2L3_9PEZI|nr:hypothetical protein QBC46DRAFT_267312 [Diplogelasinospora grovesii]